MSVIKLPNKCNFFNCFNCCRTSGNIFNLLFPKFIVSNWKKGFILTFQSCRPYCRTKRSLLQNSNFLCQRFTPVNNVAKSTMPSKLQVFICHFTAIYGVNTSDISGETHEFWNLVYSCQLIVPQVHMTTLLWPLMLSYKFVIV